jgi:hypothetical protein
MAVDSRATPFDHFVGGSHAIRSADCPNCDKPLMQYMSINTADDRLNLGFLGVDRLPLLYCMRCALCWRVFEYYVKSSDAISIVRVHRGERTWDDWYGDGFGDELPKRYFDLYPIPEHIQYLHGRISRGYQPTDAEELEISRFTGKVAQPEVGGYPIVDAINQIGGETFFVQPINTPMCRVCKENGMKRHMSFVASLVNDDRTRLRIGHDGVQVLFFTCCSCGLIHVIHRI